MVAGCANVNSNEYSRSEKQRERSRGIVGSLESHVDRYRLMKLLFRCFFGMEIISGFYCMHMNSSLCDAYL